MSLHHLVEYLSRLVAAAWLKYLDDEHFDPESVFFDLKMENQELLSPHVDVQD